MPFSSLSFLFLFFPLSLVQWVVAPAKRNGVLLALSLLFYFWGGQAAILVLLGTIGLTYVTGLIMEHFDEVEQRRKQAFVLGVAILLGLFAFFAYLPRINHQFPALLAQSPLANWQTPPPGLSIYLLLSLSYLIDLYRRDCPVQLNFTRLGAYISAYPTVLGGPITRYQNIGLALKRRTMDLTDFGEGAELFIGGLAKKVLLADGIGALWTEVSGRDLAALPVGEAWLGLLAFAFMLYFDFSGYAQMAIGLGRMIGFHFPENFNYPYLAQSVSAFWMRWQITLVDWFRRYIYFSLGGSRAGKAKMARNVMITWLLLGFWLGFGANYLIFGFYFGFFILIERLFLRRILQKLPKFLCWFYTIFVVLIGWVFLAVQDFGGIRSFFGSLFALNGEGKLGYWFWYNLRGYGFLFFLCFFFSTPALPRFFGWTARNLPTFSSILRLGFALVLLILSIAFLVSGSSVPFALS